jgi:hypothetical protein
MAGPSTHWPGLRRTAAGAGTAALAGLAAAHGAWALGASWPAPDRNALAELVAGSSRMPSPTACWTVAGCLAAAAWVSAGFAGRGPLPTAAKSAVIGALAVRALAGLTGRTDLMVPWTPSPTFIARDRRILAPACAVLSGLLACGIRPGTRGTSDR